MAWIERRPRSGGETSYRVRWRTGGRREGAPEVATFYEEGQAANFKLLVDQAGQLWPSDDALRALGFDDLCDEPEPDRPDEVVRAPLTSGEYIASYVEVVLETQSVKGYERKKNRQRLRHRHAVSPSL